MRILALLATYNEDRFIANCLEHLIRQGAGVYLIDNASSDATVAIAERYLGRGLQGIETLPRAGVFDFKRILQRKEALAASLDADWFLHVDADEVRLAPRAGQTLAEAIEGADGAGYNAVNFQEYTFVPTVEAPDHDHDRYLETMRRYYPFTPFTPHRLSAWKRPAGRVDLATTGGHAVRFDGLRMFPQIFPMRHYMCLSIGHALRKYGERKHPRAALEAGWHGWREQLDPGRITLPHEAELRPYVGDAALDDSRPRTSHAVIVAT